MDSSVRNKYISVGERILADRKTFLSGGNDDGVHFEEVRVAPAIKEERKSPSGVRMIKNDDLLKVCAGYASSKSESFFTRASPHEGKFIAFSKKAIDIFKIEKTPEELSSDIYVYFDDTVFGKGDKGFALTSSMMISTSNSSFFVPYGVVKKISYPGFFSKELKITTNSGQIFSLKLSQSAAGQKKIFDILKAYLKNIG